MPMLPDLMTSVPTFLCLVAAGYVLGVVGNVGGPLFVLILLSVDGLPTATAIGTAMCVSCLITMIAVLGHWQQNNLRADLAWSMGAAGAVGCLIGAIIAVNAPVQVLEPLLSIVVMVIPVLGLVRLFRARRCADTAVIESVLPTGQRSKGATIGAVVGSFCGAFGLGGAAPIAALSRMVLHQPMRISIGTAYVAALCISATGTLFYAFAGQIHMQYTVFLVTGCGLGIFLSTRAVNLVPDRILEGMMMMMMIVLALLTQISSWRAL